MPNRCLRDMRRAGQADGTGSILSETGPIVAYETRIAEAPPEMLAQQRNGDFDGAAPRLGGPVPHGRRALARAGVLLRLRRCRIGRSHGPRTLPRLPLPLRHLAVPTLRRSRPCTAYPP